MVLNNTSIFPGVSETENLNRDVNLTPALLWKIAGESVRVTLASFVPSEDFGTVERTLLLAKIDARFVQTLVNCYWFE